MTLPPDVRVTTEMLWRGALIFALLDAGFVPLAAFEFIFYWCVILSTATIVQQGWQWLRGEM